MQTADGLSDVVAIRLSALRATHAGKFAEAVRLLAPVVEARPNDAAIQLDYANALAQAELNARALSAYDHFIELKPEIAIAHSNRSYVLNKLGQHVEAEAAARRALELAPDDSGAANNLSHAVKLQGRYEEAAAILGPLVIRDPERVEAINNLGDCMRAECRLDEAEELFLRAIRISPDFAHAHLNRALCRLQRGDYITGFREYEWRLRLGLPLQHPGDAAPWDGTPAPGRTLFIETEQGHGDAIQFVRFIQMARKRVARTVLVGRSEQLALLATAPAVEGIATKSGRLPADALHVSLMSLPHCLGLDRAGLQVEVPYLRADPQRMARWREWVATLPGRRVGLCWQGRPGIQPDLGRSVPLADLAPLTGIPDVTMIGLQKHHGTDQLVNLPTGMRVVMPPDEFDQGPDAFLDTAALMMSLDLVISVDSAIAHLAGALACPVWLMLRRMPDWRWGIEGRETIWYPTMRLYRQTENRIWRDPIERMANDLRDA
jgi:tetratricopeptide (TPR) repeat protein